MSEEEPVPDGFKMTELGPLPEEWDVVEIGSTGRIITGRTPSTKNAEYYNGPFMFIKPPDFTNNRYIFKSEKTITSEGLEEVSSLPKDSVLVVCIGSLGKVALTCEDNCATNQQINAIIPDDEHEPEYLYYTLLHHGPRLLPLAGGVTVKIVNKSNFSRFLIPRPPLPEQKCIATVLSTVQDAIERTDAVIRATRELKRSMLQHLFTYGPVRLVDAEKVELNETEWGMIPEDWNVVKLDELKSEERKAIVAGPFGSNIGKRFFVKEGIPVIRGNNLTTGERTYVDDGYVFITEEKAEELSTCTALQGDLIFTAAGTIGQVGIIPSNARFKKYIISNKQMRVRVNEDVVLVKYLFYWFTSSFGQRIINTRRRGTSIPVINLSILRNLPVPIPRIKTQNIIVNILNVLEEELFNENMKREAQEHLFKSLLSNLMVGKVRVSHLEVAA